MCSPHLPALLDAPDRDAIGCGDETLTYGQLAGAAGWVATRGAGAECVALTTSTGRMRFNSLTASKRNSGEYGGIFGITDILPDRDELSQ